MAKTAHPQNSQSARGLAERTSRAPPRSAAAPAFGLRFRPLRCAAPPRAVPRCFGAFGRLQLSASGRRLCLARDLDTLRTLRRQQHPTQIAQPARSARARQTSQSEGVRVR